MIVLFDFAELVLCVFANLIAPGLLAAVILSILGLGLEKLWRAVR